MKAMILDRIVSLDDVAAPLRLVEMPTPTPDSEELLVRVSMQSRSHRVGRD